MIRSFIAISLPDNVHEALEKFERDLRKSNAAVSWVRPDKIHLTLKFLGNVSEEQIEEIQSAMREIASGTPPFRLQPSGCGAFPTMKQMRVVWVGLSGDGDPLRRVQKDIETALIPMGFKPEDRSFKPHLTLGRVKGRQGLRSLQEILLANQAFEAEAFDVRELVLYKSDLRPEGAVYTPLYKAALAGKSGQ